MTNSDKLLERIARRVNNSGQKFDLTITVGGTVITGRLTPRAAWLGSNIDVLNEVDTMKPFIDEFAAEGGEPDDQEYIHLTEAQVVFGAVPTIQAGTGYLRIPLNKVDSWALGSLEIRPGQG